MAPRRKRAVTRRRKFKGLRVIDTATDLYTANAVTTAFTGQGLFGTFLEPFMPGYQRIGGAPGVGGLDGALDIKEIFDGLMGRGLFKSGTTYGKGYIVEGGGAPATSIMGLGGAVQDHLMKGAVPAAIRVVGAGVVKKVMKKTIARPLNKITRQIGMSDFVRW